MRVFSHALSLSGVGHFVRAFEIARAVGERHEVAIVDGGRPVPRARVAGGVTAVEIPRIERAGGRLAAIDTGRTLADTLAERIAALERAVRRLRPDALLVEYFPFSKWELEPEFRALIEAARACRPSVAIVCSLRDVPSRTRFDEMDEAAAPYPRRVASALEAFDAVLVHADPRVTRIEEHVPWLGDLRVPVTYTGYVSEKLELGSARRREILAWLAGRGAVVASAGGNARGAEVLRTVVSAWRELAGEGLTAGRVLVVFCPLGAGEDECQRLRALAGESPVRVEPFDPDFLAWLAVADLSIGRAGYNTCANILETRRRALLIPDETMSDQPFRARRLGALGLADLLDAPTPERCAAAILRALGRSEPTHDVALDGAAETRRFLEAM